MPVADVPALDVVYAVERDARLLVADELCRDPALERLHREVALGDPEELVRAAHEHRIDGLVRRQCDRCLDPLELRALERPLFQGVAEDHREARLLGVPAVLGVRIEEDDGHFGAAELLRQQEPQTLCAQDRHTVSRRELHIEQP